MPACPWEGKFSTSQLKRWFEAIPLRFACRRFTAPASVEQQSALAYTAARVSLPGVRLALLDCDSNQLFYSLPFISRIDYARQYVAVIIDGSVPNAELHAGISGEAIVLEITSMGLGSCWVQGTFRRSAVDIPISDREKILAVIPYGQPSSKEGKRLRRRKPLKALCLDKPENWPNWAFQAAETVRTAPSAFNRQPWRFSCSGNTMRLSGKGFCNINFGIATLHIECALHQLPHTWRFSSDAKGLLVNFKEEL